MVFARSGPRIVKVRLARVFEKHIRILDEMDDS